MNLIKKLINFNDNKIIFYRIVLIGIALEYIGLAILYKTNSIIGKSTLSLNARLIILTFLGIMFFLSFKIRKIKDNSYKIAFFITITSLVHLLISTYLNNFNLFLSTTILLIIFIANLIFQTDKLLLYSNLIYSLLLITAILIHPEPIINTSFFITSYIILNTMSYIISSLNYAAEKKFKNLAKKYETILNNTTDSVVLIEIDHSKFRYNKVNDAYQKYIGLTKEEIVGKTPEELHENEYATFLEEKFDKCLRKKEVIVFDEVLKHGKEKKYWHTKLSPVIIDDKVKQIVGISRDISEERKANKKIKELTFKDNLTGLYNRTYFQKKLKTFSIPTVEPLSIIIGDVNGLKLTNDAFGHEKGDQLLKRVANKIKSSCRKKDIIARWGGDEFVIFLPSTNFSGAQKVCKRIKDKVSSLEADPVKPSIALGCAVKNNNKQNLDNLFRKAEDRMYKNKLAESKNAHGTIIKSLKQTFHNNTCETKEHCERLKKLSVKLGKEIHLEEHLINDLKLLAEMHDIGKVAVSKKIINKKGKLTDNEWNNIKRHSEIGYQIASSSPELSSIADEILNHHERWDGKGYPLGKKGEEIPVLARIISIVDAYDVMISKRPYKKALNRKKAITELKREAGTQFDPKLVKIFIEKVLGHTWKGDKYDTA